MNTALENKINEARIRKAQAITDFLSERWGAEAGALAPRMNGEQWAKVAELCGERSPSEATQQLIIAMLHNRKVARARRSK